MKFLALVIIFISSIYTLSFAKYCWKKKKRKAAVGAAILTFIAIVFPIAAMFELI